MTTSRTPKSLTTSLSLSTTIQPEWNKLYQEILPPNHDDRVASLKTYTHEDVMRDLQHDAPVRHYNIHGNTPMPVSNVNRAQHHMPMTGVRKITLLVQHFVWSGFYAPKRRRV
jgi:hypothetical protein